jgi:hypothetical protein
VVYVSGRHPFLAWDAVALAAAKLLVGAWVLHLGFTHVSDDDFSRVVISEQFAEAPWVDPSGTSWLPLPFWVEGMAMMATWRSLEVARAVALALGCAGVLVFYISQREVGVHRLSALAATGAAMVLPWNAWLGVASVPDGWTGALIAASALAVGRSTTRTWAVFGLLAASLCRYEAWPACAVAAAICVWWSRRVGEARRTKAAVALAGPVLWMAWNIYAHGSPVHFLARVAAFRHAVGAADAPLSAKLLDYPLALLHESPEAVVLGAVGLLGFFDRELRVRWSAPAVAAAAIFAFLVWGDVHDGAPTHHPARALGAIWWIAFGMGADAVHALVARASEGRVLRVVWAVVLGAAGVAWGALLPGRWAVAPGEGPGERRDAQIARGVALREEGAEHAEITPCAYEHFALIAAWGEPERATILPSRHTPVTADCPEVTVVGSQEP